MSSCVVARVEVCNLRDRSRCAGFELLVDTGSMYTWIEGGRLRGLGIEPTGRRVFGTIGGRVVEREIGEAVIGCMGERATCIVVFAREGDAEVLGVTALENLALEVDPTTKQFRRVEAVPAL
ncbi:hypothetical protein [Thermofilum pendens]|uniref:hypothetical protein n=1 Tax=Thermofilum pendens TaxID=2269 RepID=UPI001FE19E66|nr:hypothetical protein [Thermofilum pendens]